MVGKVRTVFPCKDWGWLLPAKGQEGLSRHANTPHLDKAWAAGVHTFVKAQPTRFVYFTIY